MKKTLLTLLLVGLPILTQAQVMVNSVDLNESTDTFELYVAKKPFTNDECVFIDYGQKGFKRSNYDLRDTQAVYDKDGNKFKKGDYSKLLRYLENEGWKMKDKRQSEIGTVKTDIIIFGK